MPRPVFAPNDAQRAILTALARVAEQRARVDAEADKLIKQADALAVPISQIAEHAKVTRKTVYRHLGRPMK
jgi:AcrR family transcriptional regulator